MRAIGLLTCVAVTGCTFTSPTGTNPDGSIPIDQVPPDAQVCFGAGLGKVCLKQPPSQPRSLTGMIDTTIDTVCTEIISVTGTEVCVIAATSIDLAVNATVRGVGTRPLMIVAAGTLQILGVLDVGSQRGTRGGAGAADTTCPDLGTARNDDGGGGGGAGGSFFGAGGNGGNGDTNDNGQPTGSAQGGTRVPGLTPMGLRGGCRGGNGGSGGQGSNPGVGGRGGGAIYLVSGSDIKISGRVVAYGAGGGGGNVQGGGGGGGSGGMIGLDAPTIIVSGALAANGGGGGEGAGLTVGVSGNDGSVNELRAEGGIAASGDGGNNDGGNGGQGSGGALLTGDTGGNDTGGAGGGGGGAGFIYIKGPIELSGTASPPPSVAP